MSYLRGLMLLGICVFAGTQCAQGAFWNRKSSKEEPARVAPPPPTYAVTPVAGAQPVQSLSSYSDRAPELPDVPPAEAASPQHARRAHFRMPDQEAVDTLVQLADSRRMREEEIRVLARLLREKEGELVRMNDRLRDRFGIAADANYQYDNETKGLFLLVPKSGESAVEGEGADEVFEKRLHRTLDAKQTEIEFVRLVSAKKITASEIQVLKLLLKEKNLELGKVHASLEERFAISPEKHYEFDAPSRTLFEVVGPLGGTDGGNLGL